jgi:hypothetical protein
MAVILNRGESGFAAVVENPSMISISLVLAGAFVAALPGAENPPDLADLAQYEEMSRGVGGAPAAQVRLALWCEAHGLVSERSNHLSLAVLCDPKYAAAPGLAGAAGLRGPGG